MSCPDIGNDQLIAMTNGLMDDQTAPVHASDVTASKAFYATKPTRWTVFLRTFVPWQLLRFG
jgi:hypothetical protein